MPVWQPVGRPIKTLAEHVRDGTFRPVRHAHLLGEDDGSEWLRERYGVLPDELEEFRTRYRAAQSDRERQAIALDFRDAADRFGADAPE